MISKKELALKALTLALTVSLAGTSVAMGNPMTVNAAEGTPTTVVAQVEEKWTPATPYIGMQLGKTWGDWDYTTAEPGFSPTGYSTSIKTEWLSDPRFVLVQERAMVISGAELLSMFLKPVGMEYIMQGNSTIYHTDAATRSTVTKTLAIGDLGYLEANETFWGYMQDFLMWTVERLYATEIGNTTLDVYEDSDYARFTFNVTRVNPDTGLTEKGYTVYVWSKKTNRVTCLDYVEAEANYNDTRALNVVYSYMPLN